MRLATDGTPLGDAITGEIVSDGDYRLDAVTWTGAGLLTLEGRYFDETAGNFSGESRRLNAAVAVEGAVDTNVNVYTHFVAARTRALMASGSGFGDAHEQAVGELQGLVGIAAHPGRLDLLDVGDTVAEDSANLLLFSAALLTAGHDQAGIDAIAADFADNGAVDGSATTDGDGLTAWDAVVQAAQNDPSLLEDARSRLVSQYSGKNPPMGSSSSFGWMPDLCTTTHLAVDNRPVICTNDDDPGPISRQAIPGRARGAAAFVAMEAGYYRLELGVPLGETAYNGNNWGLYRFDDSDDREECANTTAYSEGNGSRYIEGLTGRVGPSERYCLGYYVGPSMSSGGASELEVGIAKVSEGGPAVREAVRLALGEAHRGVVGNLVTAGSDMPSYSYYTFVAPSGGNYRITASGYNNGGSGSLRIGLFSDQDRDGEIEFYNDADRADFVGGPGTTSNSTVMDASLASGVHAIRIFNGTAHRANQYESGRLTGIGFDLVVERQ